MIVLSMVSLNEPPSSTYDILRELKDGYVIDYHISYDINDKIKMHISLVLQVSVDELYNLQSEKRENIIKFKDGITEALYPYIRRKL